MRPEDKHCDHDHDHDQHDCDVEFGGDAEYHAHGVRFQHPGDWTVTEDVGPDETTISVQSSGVSFWSLTLIEDAPDPADVIETVLGVFRAEYTDLDIYLSPPIAGFLTVAYDLEFVCLDVMNTARVESFRTNRRTALIVSQGPIVSGSLPVRYWRRSRTVFGVRKACQVTKVCQVRKVCQVTMSSHSSNRPSAREHSDRLPIETNAVPVASLPVTPGTPPDPRRLGPAFRELCDVIAKLRSPSGCPWDREQTLATIKPFTLEETYELLEAIDSGDDAAIVEELGDVLLQVVLDSQIAADEGRFELSDVVAGLTRKMIERHPHVFGDTEAATAADVSRHWDRIKQQEKQRESIFDGLPLALPALARAARISGKAARVGYDFPARDMLFDKLREELNELAVELFPGGQTPARAATVEAQVEPDPPPFDAERQRRIEGELGDVLFVLANIARRWHINPEEALRASNDKFVRRVQYIERRLKERGSSLRDATLSELEILYQEGKRAERTISTSHGHE